MATTDIDLPISGGQIRTEAQRFFILPSDRNARYATTQRLPGPEGKPGLWPRASHRPPGNRSTMLHQQRLAQRDTPSCRHCATAISRPYTRSTPSCFLGSPPPSGWIPTGLMPLPTVARTPSTSIGTHRCVRPVLQLADNSGLVRIPTGALLPFSTVRRASGACRSRQLMAIGSTPPMWPELSPSTSAI